MACRGIVVFVFFVGSLVLVNPGFVYVSPDETANAYFAKRFAESLSLRGPSDHLLQSFDRLHPRSTLVDGDQFVPGSFLGLPTLYGAISALVGTWVLWILTPVLTIGAALGFGALIRRLISDPAGSISVVLFLLHPAVWYYSARGLMHNMLFLDLIVIAGWLWVCRPLGGKNKEASAWNDVSAGLCIGLAVFVRTSEFLWMSVALLAMAIMWWNTLCWRRLRAGMLGLAVGLGWLMLMNFLTYGHPFTTGYTMDVPPTEWLPIDSVDVVTLLPFGLHPMNAWRHFIAYAVTMFWWLSALALPGFFLLFVQKAHRRTVRCAAVLGVLVSVWLVLMYGSWEIHDNPDPTQVTMANSYVRYWLPMYVFSIPLMAVTIQWISRLGRRAMARGFIMATLLLAVIGLNIHATFIQGQDGLIKMRAELQSAQTIQASVLRYTQANSVIIVDRGDKLFFPHRHVWYPLRDELTYAAMPALLEESAALYYYGITFPQTDLDYLNTSRLGRMGLGIELVETYEDESLYRIVRNEEPPPF